VTPPLYPGVVEPYLVLGAWFPNHFVDRGNSRVQVVEP
jgi:hypothetical protein